MLPFTPQKHRAFWKFEQWINVTIILKNLIPQSFCFIFIGMCHINANMNHGQYILAANATNELKYLNRDCTTIRCMLLVTRIFIMAKHYQIGIEDLQWSLILQYTSTFQDGRQKKGYLLTCLREIGNSRNIYHNLYYRHHLTLLTCDEVTGMDC